jgi:hypothetical protein
MKKHPIDQFFAEKLRNQEVTPRPAAWERLQERLPGTETRRQLRWGYWAAAASVAALVLAGTWLWFPRESEGPGLPRRPELAQQKVPAASRKEPPAPVPVPPSGRSAEEENAAEAPLTTEYLANTPPRLRERATSPEPRAARQARPEAEVSQVARTLEEVPAATPVAVAQTEAKPRVEAPATPTAQVFILHVTEPVLLAQGEESVPAASVEMPSVPSVKPKFMNRLVKRVKLIKQGDFREAGLDPGLLLARAEDKVEGLIKK